MGKVHASLFSGFGAADLAAEWMCWDNAFWCEIDDFPRTVLSYWFPKSKGYGNIKETDFKFWRGKIDVLTGGFPCQPFSVAGQRKGQEDDRYLWPEMLRAIREIRPTWVIGENVGGIISMVQPSSEVTVESQASLFEASDKETLLEQEYVVETVCRDLEQEGYSIQPIVIPACAVEAPHRRDRIFFIAYCSDARTKGVQREGKDGIYQSKYATNANIIRYQRECVPEINDKKRRENKEGFFKEHAINNRRLWKRFPTQPPVCRRDDGLPFDVERLTISFTAWRTGSIKGYGNAIVPQVMYEIFKVIETIQD